MKSIVMIGSTHFDPVWTWTWEEGMSSIHSTFQSALDRMKEDKDFIYSFATPPVFEWIREMDPEMFEEIQEQVRQGRWELCEGWWKKASPRFEEEFYDGQASPVAQTIKNLPAMQATWV